MKRNDIILSVQELTKTFRGSRQGLLRHAPDFTAVDRVSFDMYRGEMLGLLGESGCGKSTLARMLIHLIHPSAGRIILEGQEIQGLSESAFRKQRQKIQMVYQNPFDCLDPSKRIRSLLAEPLRIWSPASNEQQREEKILHILAECELPADSLERFPREFSGGQLQRLSIARALLIDPEILIADEIISALDVSIQNQILNLLLRMKEEHHLTILFITHDLSVARRVSDRVMVMQTGRIKGIGTPEEVFSAKADPYIRQLADAVFSFDGRG